MSEQGQRIKARRKQIGISAEQLAERLQIAPATIYRYESGEIAQIKHDRLVAIASALGVNADYLDGNADLSAATRPEPLPQPDIETPAKKAIETLIKHRVSAAPVLPLAILQQRPDVICVSFTEFADNSGMDSLVAMFGAQNQDAVTYARRDSGVYVVAYNQRLPFYMLQIALARELGHIVLGHNETQPQTKQTAEALVFARHLLCPRPVIAALNSAGVPLTVETVGTLTGCYGRVLASLRQMDGAHVPAQLNRRVRAQFAEYIDTIAAHAARMHTVDATAADFGAYMDNYAE